MSSLKKYGFYLLLVTCMLFSIFLGYWYANDHEELQDDSQPPIGLSTDKQARAAVLAASFQGQFPTVRLLSIDMSPFHSSFEAHIEMDGVRSKVAAGQTLANGVQVRSVDVKTLSLALGPQVRHFSLPLTPIEIRAQESGQAVLELSERFKNTDTGIVVMSETPLGLSSNLGLMVGDVVNQVNGQGVRSVDDLKRILRRYDPGVDLVFKGIRKGEAMTWQFQAEDNG